MHRHMCINRQIIDRKKGRQKKREREERAT